MRITSAVLLGSMIVTPAISSTECTFPQREPIQNSGGLLTLFMNPCGVKYEAGYRLEGNTLHFPFGGSHALRDATQEEAEAALREAYGLVGEREKLVRTKW